MLIHDESPASVQAISLAQSLLGNLRGCAAIPEKDDGVQWLHGVLARLNGGDKSNKGMPVMIMIRCEADGSVSKRVRQLARGLLKSAAAGSESTQLSSASALTLDKEFLAAPPIYLILLGGATCANSAKMAGPQVFSGGNRFRSALAKAGAASLKATAADPKKRVLEVHSELVDLKKTFEDAFAAWGLLTVQSPAESPYFETPSQAGNPGKTANASGASLSSKPSSSPSPSTGAKGSGGRAAVDAATKADGTFEFTNPLVASAAASSRAGSASSVEDKKPTSSTLAAAPAQSPLKPATSADAAETPEPGANKSGVASSSSPCSTLPSGPVRVFYSGEVAQDIADKLVRELSSKLKAHRAQAVGGRAAAVGVEAFPLSEFKSKLVAPMAMPSSSSPSSSSSSSSSMPHPAPTTNSTMVGVFVVQTVEHGTAPEDGQPFLRWLKRKDHRRRRQPTTTTTSEGSKCSNDGSSSEGQGDAEGLPLSGLSFGVLGIGDSNLLLDRQTTTAKDCNQVAQLVDKHLYELGGERMLARGEGDERQSAATFSSVVDEWSEKLAQEVLGRCGSTGSGRGRGGDNSSTSSTLEAANERQSEASTANLSAATLEPASSRKSLGGGVSDESKRSPSSSPSSSTSSTSSVQAGSEASPAQSNGDDDDGKKNSVSQPRKPASVVAQASPSHEPFNLLPMAVLPVALAVVALVGMVVLRASKTRA